MRQSLVRIALSVALAVATIALGCDRSSPPPSPSSSGPGAAGSTANAAGSGAPASPPIGPRARKVPAASFGEAAGVHYLELVTGDADPKSTLPLVLAIHGLGDRPETFSTVLSELDTPARIVFPRGPSSYHNGFSWFPLEGALDSEETSKGIIAAADTLTSMLAEIAKTKPTSGKPIVTGFSQGGALSFAIAALHPEAVRAAFPVGGWVAFPIPAKFSDQSAMPPLIELHGGDDLRVPIGPTRDAVAKLQAAGMKAEQRVFPGVGHALPEPLRRELHGLIKAAIARP